MSTSVRDQLHAAAMSVEELGDIDRAITSGVQARNRALALAAAAGLAAVVVVLASVVVSNPLRDVQPEPLQPTPTPTPTSTSVVNGWPTSGRNAAGDYSLDGDRCGLPSGGGPWCTYGFMHNGYGSGDVDIGIYMGSAEVIPDDGGTSVSIAGYDGTYRQITPHQEDWTVDIEGTPVAIDLTAKPSTSRADLAEAHAIIDSMRTEPSSNDVGFRLVFTLTTNDWDSG